ncbi:MAG: polyisoprenoid-binding protein [Actinobacteria bacterium 13_1_20CM_3_68_9]|nr:MAG: polyisoprenoid-binding protein [Actinobacteria bacterium 13_1_20CM_3_68_9]
MTQLQTEEGVVRVPAGTWNVDPAHSSVGFEVRHMKIATVRGHFKEFEGTIEAADDSADCRAYGTVKVASIDTGNPDRDAHLRSPDFFDAERYPEMRFVSTNIEHLTGGNFRIVGELTIRDQIREIELEGIVNGADEDPWGNARVGVSVRGTINRTDFGLRWQQVMASGSFLVGEEVDVVIDVSAVRE